MGRLITLPNISRAELSQFPGRGYEDSEATGKPEPVHGEHRDNNI